MSSEYADVTAHPVLRGDAVALVGLLAILEGWIISGSLQDQTFFEHVRQRLVKNGHLTPEGGPAELGQALHDINQRLRFALGEYDTPPPA